MTVSYQPFFPQTLKNYLTQLTNASGTTAVSLAAAGANGSKIESLLVYSSETSTARDLIISVNNGTTTYPLTTVSIPYNSGFTNAVPCVDILRNSQFPGLATDERGNKYLYLASGWSLYVNAGSTITSGNKLNIFAQGYDY